MSAFAATAALAGSVAAAIALAPIAVADEPSLDGCRGSSCSKPAAPPKAFKPSPNRNAAASVPQGWKNDAQWARPGSNPFGKGPKPPMVALD
ncbi:hypothetical protein [Mycolicibacterium sp.]|uniref:hypothetical protein n=1 Tax=Mycolicibacterium sp. TaxID=2320850 RepID=UPI001DC43C46|nr:hypothetical protein [Mycolicibacterium sp.]MCB1263917.1 hypothetical protein [Mycobacterium sp.]MCB1291141.1 hypothetical protein [Mycobacterium sp.]MCB9408456.1 hypothetical protein [Mycolicibacterium sp.]